MNRSLCLSLAAAAAMALGSAALAAPYNPGDLAAGQAAATADVCRSVMRLEPGEAHYNGCLESLSRALKGLEQNRGVQDAHAACMAKGLEPGSPALSACTVTLSEAEDGGRLRLAVGSADGLTVPGGKKSYAMASNGDIRARERLACALLGLDPTHAGFQGCVADLAQTLFALDNPQR